MNSYSLNKDMKIIYMTTLVEVFPFCITCKGLARAFCMPSYISIIKSSIFWNIMLCRLYLLSASCLFLDASTLKMEVTCSSETSTDFHWTTQCYIPEDTTLHNYCRETLTTYISIIYYLLFHTWLSFWRTCWGVIWALQWMVATSVALSLRKQWFRSMLKH
jgi:hypothetical protein